MTREWKPGDVAMVRQSGCDRVALRGPEFWTDDCGTEWDDSEVAKYGRPLVAIDPDDTEQVERLIRYLADQCDWFGMTDDSTVPHMQEALRSLLAPPPFKPDEPTTWGVVEASCVHSQVRKQWIHHPDGNWWPAWDYSQMPDRTPQPDDWGSLVDPAIIREGVPA